MIRRTILALAALTITACAQPSGGGGGGTPQPQPTTLGGSWQLIALNGGPAPANVTLEFGPGNEVGGNAPCNRYFGQYTAGSDFSFSLPQVGATRRACPQLQAEGTYFNALSAATQYRPGREGDTFALLDGTGRTVASYVRAGAQQGAIDLTGNWTITAAQVNGVLTPNPGPSGAGITFGGATREFNANLGCNTASGPYTQNGNELDFGAIAVTARQCFAPAPLEGPLLAAFDLVRTAVSTGPGVDLIGANGQPLIRLVR